ncbi:MAG: discoidin domain-containing protein [Anaerolineales bacterium]|nr:discoidin domain-containing protein [Anaerolineales bacterium]
MARFSPQRLLLTVLAAGLQAACAPAQITVTPITPQVATPFAIEPLATDTAAPSPTASEDPTRIAQLTAVTATLGPTDTPAPTATPDVSPTSIIALPPTDTSTPLPTATVTQTPTRTTTPTRTPFGGPTAAGGNRTTTPGAGTATQPAVAGTAPKPLPSGVLLTRDYEVSNEGGEVIGTPGDMRDARELTWASLRGEGGAWVLTLQETRRVAGLRLFAQRDGATETTVALTRIEVSVDGTTWEDAFVPSGKCGTVANCLSLTPQSYQEIGFTPVEARYVRLRSGPTRFAFGEIEVAIAP